jgi:hypothetical protein
MTATTATPTVKQLVARQFETINRHDTRAFASNYQSNAKVSDPWYPEPLSGVDALAKDFDDFFVAFPDFAFTLVRVFAPPPAELLEMKLVEVPEVIEQGRTVELKMEVKNLRDEDLLLAVGGAPAFQSSHPEYYGQFDFMVTAFDENTLYWRYYYKFGRLDGILGVEISAGETLVLTHEWDGRDVNGQIMKPGRYNITGLYEIIGISGEKETFVKDHEIGYYTTEPMEIVIE